MDRSKTSSGDRSTFVFFVMLFVAGLFAIPFGLRWLL